MKIPLKPLFIFILISHSWTIFAQISLPKLISDGMILQRNQPVNVWGWAQSYETVQLEFGSDSYTTKADADGHWTIELPPQPAGGPFVLSFHASNTIHIQDVWFGDVWLASGQSNMELPMERVKFTYKEEMHNDDFPLIRQFTVPDGYDFHHPHTDVDAGHWVAAHKGNLSEFSAVAYFFAKHLHQEYNIPIGIINSALGGSPIEAWMSEEYLKKFPYAYEELSTFRNQCFVDSTISSDQTRNDRWYSEMNGLDKGVQGKEWQHLSLQEASKRSLFLETMELPGYWWNTTTLGDINGVVWFKKTIELSEDWEDKEAALWLGRVVDQDYTYINGEFVGYTSYQYPPRRYRIPAGVLQAGENEITIRAINSSGKGGFFLDKPYFIALPGDTLDLRGSWNYELGTQMPTLESQTFVRWKAGGLYNKMIHPLVPYALKGVIWYQGESNTKAPSNYAELKKALIDNWRKDWNQAELPFLYVQLANFMAVQEQPMESNWAELRDQQRQSLALHNTGMAVSIDLGEWNDIHPLRKKPIGDRLALEARRVAYNDELVSSGPLPNHAQFLDHEVQIYFKHVGDGLVAKDAPTLQYFELSADGTTFVPAQAHIYGNTVRVSSENLRNPIAVRYAWAHNPESANLYNRAGLPASPFELRKQSGLAEVYRDHFKIGTAINTTIARSSAAELNGIVEKHFNTITAENVLKAESVQPEKGRWDFSEADAFVQYGLGHDHFVVGHTLVWHNQTPEFYFKKEDGTAHSSDEMIQIMEDHIQRVTGRYVGKIDAWDVVNEVIDNDGSYRPTLWVEAVGDGDLMVKKAFQFAESYAPDTELYYNDFNAWRPEKRDGIMRMARMLQHEGIRIDGIGMQGHWGLNYPDLEYIEAAIDSFATLGLKVMITELDIDVLPLTQEGQIIGTGMLHPQYELEEFERYLDPYPHGLPEEVQEKLSQRYAELFTLFVEKSAAIDRVTFWGVHDSMSWKNDYPINGRTNYPLLFNRDLSPKPAVQQLLDYKESNQ